MTIAEPLPGDALPGWKNVRVSLEDGIAWVELNRPDKRNAMNPALNADMVEVLDFLEADDRCRCWCSRARATPSRPEST